MHTTGVSELRSRLPSYLRQVERGEIIVVVSRGREIARIMPMAESMLSARKALRTLRGKSVVGDVLSPVTRNWKAAK
jgi:prevent-host-death family protein